MVIAGFIFVQVRATVVHPHASGAQQPNGLPDDGFACAVFAAGERMYLHCVQYALWGIAGMLGIALQHLVECHVGFVIAASGGLAYRAGQGR